MPFNYKNEKKKCTKQKLCKHLFCMLYFVDVFYNMKCLKNIYFVCNFLLNMKLTLVFIFINFFSILNFGAPRYESWFRPCTTTSTTHFSFITRSAKKDLNRM